MKLLITCSSIHSFVFQVSKFVILLNVFHNRTDPSRGSHAGVVDVLCGGGNESPEDSIDVAKP